MALTMPPMSLAAPVPVSKVTAANWEEGLTTSLFAAVMASPRLKAQVLPLDSLVAPGLLLIPKASNRVEVMGIRKALSTVLVTNLEGKISMGTGTVETMAISTGTTIAADGAITVIELIHTQPLRGLTTFRLILHIGVLSWQSIVDGCP